MVILKGKESKATPTETEIDSHVDAALLYGSIRWVHGPTTPLAKITFI